MINLRFSAVQPASLHLRFGAVGGGAEPDYFDVALTAALPPAAFSASLIAEFDNAVNRSPCAWPASAWQAARPAHLLAAQSHRVSAKIDLQAPVPVVDAMPMPVQRSTGWQVLDAHQFGVDLAWLDGEALATVNRDLWRILKGFKPSTTLNFTDGERLASQASERWIELLRHRRPEIDSAYSDARRESNYWHQVFSAARRRNESMVFPWGIGRQPSPGISPKPGTGVTPKPPCYVPTQPVALRFKGLQPASLHLLFRCPNAPDPDGPAASIIVPIRSVYMQHNQVTLALAETGQPIPVRGGLSLSIDADSWVWGWSASVPTSYLPLLQAPLGEVVEVIASVNGTAFRLAIERIGRERSFTQQTMSISGRGRAAWLADPYAEPVSRSNVEAMTAQQLMLDALSENGMAIGWEIDWQIADWPVPAGAWSHTGTAMEACLAIAEAAGAYIQADRMAQKLSVLHRYPTAPWEWAAAAPDIQLPENVCVTEGFEWVDKPLYNTAFISGQQGGILAHVTRSGTAGDKPAPEVVDALITHADAGIQRGRSILSDTGRQKLITLSLPVLPETGIIVPGKLVRYTENGVQHVGLTRSVDVSANMPSVRQSIRIESHVL